MPHKRTLPSTKIRDPIFFNFLTLDICWQNPLVDSHEIAHILSTHLKRVENLDFSKLKVSCKHKVSLLNATGASKRVPYGTIELWKTLIAMRCYAVSPRDVYYVTVSS